MTIGPGTQIGHYKITAALGAGGMGEVWRATDTTLNREVAIKTLPKALAAEADRLARFEREAQLLAALNHPHIGSIYGLDEFEGTKYIAMELVEGETLEERLKSGALPIEDALRLALQIAQALEAAHDKGVVHRDLKPANIMITREGLVKVLDFGLAKAFAGDPADATAAHSPALSVAMTQAGLILGTAGYMSPEQASGQATDQRADVWSFGVVLYEMLTGLPLFSGESVPHVLAAVLQIEPDWKRLPKNLHPRIRMALERSLEKKPRRRYAGIADPRTDIEAALQDPAGLLVTPRPDGASTAAAIPLQRRLMPWAAGLILAMAAGAAAWTLRTPPPPPVNRSLEVLPDGEAFNFPEIRQIAISPDGRNLVYNTIGALSLRPLDSFDSVEIQGVTVNRSTPTFSPDGQTLALMIAPDNAGGAGIEIELGRIPVTGGAVRSLGVIGTGDDPPSSLRWGTDDAIFYAQGGAIWRISANGGVPEQIVEPAQGMARTDLDVLPRGDWILYASADTSGNRNWDTAEIVAHSLASGESRVLYSGASAVRYVPTGHLIVAIGNTLYALRLDVDAMTVTGGPVPVVSGVYRDLSSGIAQYDVSASGTLIYVPGTPAPLAGSTLAVIDRNVNIDAFPVPPGEYTDPRVSPDGLWAAYTQVYADGPDISVYSLRGDAAPRRLSFGGTSEFPLFSSDNTRVAFQSRRDGTASLYWQLADGSGGEPVRLTTAADGDTHTPDSFSPDGEWLTYTVGDADGTSIWTLELATGETEPLITETGAAQSTFSPDGRWLAYQSYTTGNVEIFVQPFPLTGARFQLPLAATNHHPGWAADGSALFYFPGQGRFASVRVTTEPGFSFGAVEPLSNSPINAAPDTRRQYDVMPDGSGFLGIAGPGNTPLGNSIEIRIVQNWFEELRQLVPVD